MGEVSDSYQARIGLISVAWHVQGSEAHFSVEMPVETELCLPLPDGTVQKLATGKHEAKCKLAVC